MCIDYTRLNEVTNTFNYLLSRVADLQLKLNPQPPLVLVLDLKNAFVSLHLKERAHERSGIIILGGSYIPLRMTFGLKNAPARFGELVTFVTEGLREPVFSCFDNFIVFSSSARKHKRQIRSLMQRFERYGLFVNVKKCFLESRNV